MGEVRVLRRVVVVEEDFGAMMVGLGVVAGGVWCLK